MGELLSVQVGTVQRHCMPEGVRVDYRHPFWTSGIFKTAVEGAVQVAPEGIAGDGQADLDNHGGPDNVVLAYDAAHYPEWRVVLELPELPYGGFGENFSVRGFSDETVRIGDTWEVGGEGGLLLQVTQPRQPCYKLARRLQRGHIVKMIHENSRGGWYLRVLRAGSAAAGMGIRLVEAGEADWTVARAVQVMYGRKRQPEAAGELAKLPALSERWKRELVED